MIRPLLALLPALPLLAIALPAAADDSLLDQGRAQSEAFLAGDIESIWDKMDADMQTALGSLPEFEAFHDAVTAQLGEEASVLDETTATEGDFGIYTRTGEWTQIDTPIILQWAFGPQGTIAGFVIQSQPVAAESARLDYQTHADLRLPFDGDWFVVWGGRDIADNYHAANIEQRFAYDFLVLDETGQSHSGDAQVPENYYCWDREILAPAEGEVIATVHDLPDLAIGESDPENPAGNHVVLALGDEEFAFLAHMQQGSLTVQQGDMVKPGDVLGLCGNSGNTSEPHLHFHLQTTPDLFDGEGLPAQFQDYRADGQEVARGEPVRGQTVAPN